MFAQLEKSRMSGLQNCGNPVATRVEGGFPRAGRLLGVEGFTKARGVLLPRTGTPAGFT